MRLIEIILPEEHDATAQELLKEHTVTGMWQETLHDAKVLIKILVPVEEAEGLSDLFQKRFSHVDGFRMIFIPVAATVPRLAEKEKEEKQLAKDAEKKAREQAASKSLRISRDELHSGIEKTTRVTSVYIALVILSSVVAAFGILRGNVAIVIGAMVIAPLLGPNVALALATTLGDLTLAREALRASIIGAIISFSFSVLVGFALVVDPTIPEIASRTTVGLGDVAIALASGSAGALAFTAGLPAAVIGVMVAVALLPPLVTVGLLVGAGYGTLAAGALLLFLINLICVNLAGVMTFLAQGVRPMTWWETEKAKKSTRIALGIWVFLFAALVLAIILSQPM